MEMTALFDTAGIDLKEHKAVKVKTKGTHIIIIIIIMFIHKIHNWEIELILIPFLLNDTN